MRWKKANRNRRRRERRKQKPLSTVALWAELSGQSARVMQLITKQWLDFQDLVMCMADEDN